MDTRIKIRDIYEQIDYINKEIGVAGIMQVFLPSGREYILLYSFEHPSKSSSMSTNYFQCNGLNITSFLTSTRSSHTVAEYNRDLHKFLDESVQVKLKFNEIIPYVIYESN